MKNSLTREAYAEPGWFNLIYTLKWVLISYAASLILLFVFAMVGTWTYMGNFGLNILKNIVVAVSVFACGFATAKHSGKKGIACGFVCGILYIMGLYIIGIIFTKGAFFNINVLIETVIAVLMAMIGGIVGVNSGSGRKRR